ncbi:hypothetical protein Acr_07g0014330 [Actinidia rufa]|uniref:Uncharacterized protein n=1 Tax=Actinidia rufa TaxID=165716 RepID=A0A7J0F027_9ERIC|nr:hypothetical protein Acr_07g0014330 [Actinidia rufa]
MLLMDTLMRQMNIPFSVEDLLHVYTVVLGNWEFRAGDVGLWLFLRHNGHLPDNFNDKFRCRSEEWKKVIQAVNNRRTSRRVSDLLVYESVYRHMIPHKPRSSAGLVFLPCASRVGLYSEMPLVWRDNKQEEGEKAVSQLMLNRRQNRVILAPMGEVEIAHYFMEANNSDASLGETNMVRFRTLVMGVGPSSSEASLLDKRQGKELTTGLSKRSKKNVREMSSAFLPSSGVNTELWKPEFSTSKPNRQVMMADFDKDHDTSRMMSPHSWRRARRQLGRAIAISERVKDQSAEMKWSKKKISSLEKQAKLDIEAADKAKLELVAAAQRQLEELEKVTYDLVWSLEYDSPYSRTSGPPSSLFSPYAAYQLGLQTFDGYVPTVFSIREQLTWSLPRGDLVCPLGINQ